MRHSLLMGNKYEQNVPTPNPAFINNFFDFYYTVCIETFLHIFRLFFYDEQ